MSIKFDLFPGNKRRAVTFIYDDGGEIRPYSGGEV